MSFVPNHKAPEVLKPREEAFHFPSPAVSPQRSTILRAGTNPVRPVRSNQLDVLFVPQPLVQRVAVVGLISDQPSRWMDCPTALQGGFYERHFVRRRTRDVHGDRKTRAVCNGHDLGPLAPFGRPDPKAPFFALAKVASINPSLRSRSPRSRRSSANAARIFGKAPAHTHAWNRRWHVWYGGYRRGKSFHGAPVRSTHRMPFSTARGSWGGRPRPPGRHRDLGMSGAIRSHWALVISIHHKSTHPNLDCTHF